MRVRQRAGHAVLMPLLHGVGARVVPLELPLTVIGRRRSADVHLPHASVSGNHACIAFDGQSFWIRDLMSRNGLFVSSRRVMGLNLEDGNTLHVGPLAFEFRVLDRHMLGLGLQGRRMQLARCSVTLAGGEQYLLDSVVTVIGSHADADLPGDPRHVEPVHALLIRTCMGLFLRDLGTGSGTRVNGRRVDQAELRSGDEVGVGSGGLRMTVAILERDRKLASGLGSSGLLVGQLDGEPGHGSTMCGGLGASGSMIGLSEGGLNVSASLQLRQDEGAA